MAAALVCPTLPLPATAFAEEGKEKIIKLDEIPLTLLRTYSVAQSIHAL